MKAKTLCAAALATLVLGSNVAKAATDLTTTGKVKVVDGVINPTDPTPDPEDPKEIIPELPEVEPNTESGPLAIAKATHLDFGTIATSTSDVTSFASALEFKNADNEDVVRGPIVQFGDLRTNEFGYTVTAKLVKQFTATVDGNDVTLDGSTITLTAPKTGTVEGAKGAAPDLATQAVTLSFDSAETIATAAKDNKTQGKGVWTLEFGYTDAPSFEKIDDRMVSKGVMLTVPAYTASSMPGAEYTAEIEWAITATP